MTNVRKDVVLGGLGQRFVGGIFGSFRLNHPTVVEKTIIVGLERSRWASCTSWS